MKTALRLLLAPYRFSVDRLFRMGEIGGAHWFTDPNTLYRRRNRLTYTRDFSNAAWTKTAASIGASDGTGVKIVEDGSSAAHLVRQDLAVVGAGGVVVFRVKAAERTWVRVQLGSAGAYFNLGAGVVGAISPGWSASMAPASDAAGYYDCQVSHPTVNATSCLISPTTGDGVITYAGDGTSGVYIARAQLETYTTTPSEYQDVPTTWAQAYLAAVGAENIYAWTDSAGTTPVTAVGDTIGLSLDRAYGGARGPEMASAGYATPATYDNVTTVVSATAFTQTVGTTLGRTYLNLTTVVGKTYEVSSSITTTDASGILLYARALPAGTGTILATSPSIASGGTARVIFTATTTTSSVLWSTQTVARIVNATGITVREIPGTHLIQATGTARPTLSARVNLLLNTATMSTQNVTTVATSYKLSFTGTGTVTLSGTSTDGPLVGTGANDRVSLTFTPTAGTLTLTVSGSVTLADLRTADDAAKNIPAYQRVGATAADHDTDGFPHYALFDGTDDSWASAATVDGSATDKVTVVAGVTKNSDAAAGMIAELSTSVAANNGSFLVLASGVYAGGDRLTYAAETRGTVATAYREVRPFTAPHSAVLTFALDNGASTPATQATGRVNGAAITGNVGTGTTAGNFGNHTLYVGSRAGSSIRFNGRLYSLVPRFGAMGEADLNRLERWTKNLMRLP